MSDRALSRSAHDRAAQYRTDDGWLAGHWPRARVLTIDTDGLLAVVDGDRPQLATRSGVECNDLPGAVTDGWPARIFLGIAAAAQFAVVVEAGSPTPGLGARWASLREVGADLDDLDAGLATEAVALVAYHARNPFCPHCGAPSVAAQAGWVRRCTREGTPLFPRSDPAVIMLVHDGGDRVVLGRQRAWPEGRFSVLAGFVEAGEPIEAAVAREVGEEVGLEVTDVRYFGSQPWPFPQSLMIGASALATTERITRRDDELAEAHWFTRADVTAAVAWGDDTAGGAPGVGPGGVLRAIPGPVSIARQLLDAWVAREF